jgi:hypothetical protein
VIAAFSDGDIDVDIDMSDNDDPWVQVTFGDTNEDEPSASLLLTAAEARMRGVELIVAADRAEQRVLQMKALRDQVSDRMGHLASRATE